MLYQLQHLLKCGECGRNFHARSSWTTTSVRNGKSYQYELATPRRYYMCNGMQGMRLRCREKPYIRAEQLEEPIWSEVKRVLQNPDLIVARKCDHLRWRQEALAAAKGKLGRVKRMRLFRRLLTLGLWRI